MKANIFLLGLVGMLSLASGQGRMAGFGEYQQDALRDTLTKLGPLMGHRWLKETGQRDYLLQQAWEPTTDEGLRCIGRWSFGPSLKVSLRITPEDTIVCLTRGSGASLIRFGSRDGVTLDLLGDVNFAGRPRRAIIADTLVIAGIQFGASGLEIHGVSNPALPSLLSRVNLPIVNDIAVKDSLVFAACEDDTLRVYSIADPTRPVLVGALRENCDLYMTLVGDYCYLIHVSGVNIVDISDPTNPRRVGRIGGGEPLAVHVRDSRAYVLIYGYGLRIFDISDPAAPRPLGSLEGPNIFDITMAETCDTLLYTPMLDVISVADPTRPRVLGRHALPGDMKYGIAVPPGSGHALVANYFDGLVVVDISLPAVPKIDTMAYAATSTEDIWVDGDRAYLGSSSAGFSILDISDPTRPRRLGQLNGPGRIGSCPAVTARDSFAFIVWEDSTQLRAVLLEDPANPIVVGRCRLFNPPRAIALRNSFLYTAQHRRFQVVNVARPREPVLVGSCALPFDSWKVHLSDTLAFVANVTSLQVINVARPDSPLVIGSWGGRTLGFDVNDTVVVTASSYYGTVSLSMANPAAPYVLDSLPITDWLADALIVDTLAYVGGNALHIINVADPGNLRKVGTWVPPYTVRRIVYEPPYIYLACYDAGVVILEQAEVGLVEERPQPYRGFPQVRVYPSPSGQSVTISGKATGSMMLRVIDACGREVMRQKHVGRADQVKIDVRHLTAGLYFVEVESEGLRDIGKFVKQ